MKMILMKLKNEAYSGPGVIINSEYLNNLKVPEESVLETIEILENKKIGKKQINFRLKDWGFLDKDIGDVLYL